MGYVSWVNSVTCTSTRIFHPLRQSYSLFGSPPFLPNGPQFSLSSLSFCVAWQSPSETDVLILIVCPSYVTRAPKGAQESIKKYVHIKIAVCSTYTCPNNELREGAEAM